MLNIIRDTREKIGKWDFCEANIIDKKLESGDYSLLGLEDYICIERKKSTSEIAVNIGTDFSRFSKELERMKSIPLAYIICEFSLEQLLIFPKDSALKEKIKINGKFLVKSLLSFKEKYGVEVIFAGSRNNAISKAEELFQLALQLRGKHD